jgi:predicted permease
MKPLSLQFCLILLFIHLSSYGQSIDSLNFNVSFNYYKDLSDTYGGGSMFSGEFEVFRAWYGASISFGHFQSQSTFVFKVPVEETSSILEIPFDEMAIMNMGSFSFILIPIQGKRINTELLIGAVIGKAKNLSFKSVDYSYNINENRFTYLYKDYQLVTRNHFGYQVGVDVSFYFFKKAGLQLNARIQDLSNGGTFFFVGGGLCFRL